MNYCLEMYSIIVRIKFMIITIITNIGYCYCLYCYNFAVFDISALLVFFEYTISISYSKYIKALKVPFLAFEAFYQKWLRKNYHNISAHF